jgi:pimeloyl-ACP methyl ester carboxylesterase
MTAPTRDIRTEVLAVPGARLTYDVRPAAPGSPGVPVLLMVGSPMGAAGFGSLSGWFGDRTVVTYDPRGVERSERTDGAVQTTPAEHADDLARLVEAVGDGPVDVFASSGGAVNALELVARRPDLVRTLVAHEPPALPVLPDRDEAVAATRAVAEA